MHVLVTEIDFFIAWRESFHGSAFESSGTVDLPSIEAN